MTSSKVSFGCFGKLQKFADFVKFNSGNSEIVLFDRWLQSGLQYSKTKLSTNFNRLYSAAETVQFIFPNQKSSSVLLGTFIPSNDRSGRKYPFIVFSQFSFSITDDNPHLLTIIFDDFFSNSDKNIYLMKDKEKLDDIIPEIENNFNFGEIKVSHKKSRYDEYLSATTIGKLWNRLFGKFDDNRKYLLFSNLKEILLPFRTQQLNNFTLGLKIPIVTDNEFKYLDISFWTDVCLRLIGDMNFQPYLFWSRNTITNTSYVILFLNQPPYDSYTYLIDQSSLLDNICMTDEEGDIDNAIKSLGNRYKSLLDYNELTLKDFLNNIY